MSAWVQVAFAVGGVVAGFPVTAAMAELPNRSGAGVSLAVARDHARAATVPRPRRQKVRVRTTKQGDPWEELLLWGVGVVVAVALYAVWAAAIAVTMFWVAVATLLVTVVVFTVLYAREVFAGGRTAWLLVMTLAYAFVGVVVAFWLVEPPLHGVLEPALAAIDRDGAAGVIPYAVPLLYQAAGALASFAVLLSSIAVCTANVSAVLMEVRSPGHSWLWKSLFKATRTATSPNVGWFYLLLAVLALLLSSGLVVDWILNFQATAA